MSQLVFIILINVTILLAVALGMTLFFTLRQRRQHQQAITKMLSGVTKQQSERAGELQQKLPDPEQSDGGHSLVVRELAMAENAFYQQLLISLLDPSGNKLTQVPTVVQTLLDQYVTTLAGQPVEQADGPKEDEPETPPADSAVDPASLQNPDDIEVSLDLDALDEEIETKTTEPDQSATETGQEDPDDIEVTLDLDELDALAEEEAVAADTASENLEDIEVTMDLGDLDEPEIAAPETLEDAPQNPDDMEVALELGAPEQPTETTKQAINQNTDSSPNEPTSSEVQEPTEADTIDDEDELELDLEPDNAGPVPENKQASPVDTSNTKSSDQDDIELAVGRTQDHQPSQPPKEIPDKPLK